MEILNAFQAPLPQQPVPLSVVPVQSMWCPVAVLAPAVEGTWLVASAPGNGGWLALLLPGLYGHRARCQASLLYVSCSVAGQATAR